MKNLACVLVIFSLGMFAVGCGGKDEKKEDKKESEKKGDEAGKNINIDKGEQQEIDPNDLPFGSQDPADNGNKKTTSDGSSQDPPAGSDTKDPPDNGGTNGLDLPDIEINPPETDSTSTPPIEN